MDNNERRTGLISLWASAEDEATGINWPFVFLAFVGSVLWLIFILIVACGLPQGTFPTCRVITRCKPNPSSCSSTALKDNTSLFPPRRSSHKCGYSGSMGLSALSTSVVEIQGDKDTRNEQYFWLRRCLTVFFHFRFEVIYSYK